MIKRLTFDEARQRAEELLLARSIRSAEKWLGVRLVDGNIPILDPRYVAIDGNYIFLVNERFGLEEYNAKGAMLIGGYMYLRTTRIGYADGGIGSNQANLIGSFKYDMDVIYKHLQVMIELAASGGDRLE